MSLNSLFTASGAKNQYKQWGFDPNGNNETGAMAKRFAGFDYGTAANGLAQNAANQNRMYDEGNRLAALYSPGNQQAALDDRYRQQMGVANDQARMNQLYLQEQGLGQGAANGGLLAANNAAAHQTADYQRQLDSPEYHAQLLNVFSQLAQSNPALQRIFQMYYPTIEQRYQQNQQDRKSGGLGGFLSTLGQVAGMGRGTQSGGINYGQIGRDSAGYF